MRFFARSGSFPSEQRRKNRARDRRPDQQDGGRHLRLQRQHDHRAADQDARQGDGEIFGQNGSFEPEDGAEGFPRDRPREHRHPQEDRHGEHDERNGGQPRPLQHAFYQERVLPAIDAGRGRTSDQDRRNDQPQRRRQRTEETGVHIPDISRSVKPDGTRRDLRYGQQIAEFAHGEHLLLFDELRREKRDQQGREGEKERRTWSNLNHQETAIRNSTV